MTILVTGTSSGIGLEIAKFLIAQGQQVVGVSRRATPLTDKLFQHIQGDVTDPALYQKLSDLKELDGVVLNHGVLEPVARIEDADIDEWKRSFGINFFSLVGVVKAVLPQLRKSKGRVIAVSSGASTGGYSTWGCYGATKAAMNAFCTTLSVEEPDLISVSVAPGVVDTDMQGNIRGKHSATMGEHADKFHEMHASGQLVSPQTSGKLYGNLVLKAGKELSGKYLRYGSSSELDDFL